jgi:hypothetical protein
MPRSLTISPLKLRRAAGSELRLANNLSLLGNSTANSPVEYLEDLLL